MNAKSSHQVHHSSEDGVVLPEDGTTFFWWTRNVTAVIYFLRELTGVGIAIYMVTFVLAFYLDPVGEFVTSTWFYIISWMGLVSAIFHSLTWLAVTLKVTPFDLPKPVERIGFFLLLLIWGGVSLFLLTYFYEGVSTYIHY
ncbi:MAG: hypothetical protein Q8P27_02630 [Candidatus Peregrinibacteria bacterium]|nr:hypothetical protein [Candidatus Peregrinibacteria bacterium]